MQRGIKKNTTRMAVLLTAALLMAAGAFAQTEAAVAPPFNKTAQPKNNYVSFGGACLIAISDDMVTASPSVQASWVTPRLFMDLFGLGVHVGVIAPFTLDPFQVALGATLIAGPAMVVFDKGAFSVPLTVGAHADYISFDNKKWVWNIGAGAVADFVWQFGKKWFAYGRMQMACNFGAFEFHITPGLGMGLSW